ncbi:efflux RND transporter periplasmic adaptor subunit [Marinobacter sp. SS21]|uniref:efflux RND transporter periplasmic adaptor subunit n=1 Tax=Marinobacter sp. SS21 TaxID=2979460 RepID=UPI00232E794E|nr:efflux RND transporter periplasmic adaptor subunit [Marinobacter sp. SS21]MDC0660953.1 efflux RND transporter periplasmic adaptor subunit [Marinobacter sp. SS21]
MVRQGIIALVILALAVAAGTGYQWLGGQAAEGPQRQRAPSVVNTVTPTEQTVQDALAAVGTLKSRDAVALTTEVSGRVVAFDLPPGGIVAQGQLLLRLDDRQARADLRVAEAQLADAQRKYDRARRLVTNNSIAQSQLDELSTARDVARAQRIAAHTRLDNHRIDAPFAGTVGLTDIAIGSYLSEGDTITTLDATDRMELNFSVPERFIGQLHLGQQVTGHTPAFPGEAFRGTLVELGARINELSRTLPVRAQVANADRRLRPGQFMSVRLTLEERQALVIPEQALLIRGADSFVFVAEAGVARRVRVEVGSRQPGRVEIVAGLSPEDAVIITGQDRLSSGDAVEVVVDDAAIPDNHLARRAPAEEGGQR